MSLPNIIYGKYGMEKESSSTKNTGIDLGQRMMLPDGRIYAYAQCSSTANIGTGLLCSQKAVAFADLVLNTKGAGTVGNTTIVVTFGATAGCSKDQFAGGYIQSYSGGTVGYLYKIKTNNSAAASETTNFVLEPGDPLQAPFATATTKVLIRENEFMSVQAKPASTVATGIPVGVSNNSVTAGNYFWLQRRGPCAVLAGTVTDAVVGQPMAACSSVVGGVQLYVIGATTATINHWEIGRAMVDPATAADYAMVYLTLE